MTPFTDTAGAATRVLDTLAAHGHVTGEQLASARSAGGSDAEVGRGFVDRGLITASQLTAVLEDDLGYPRVDLESYAPDEEALALMPGAIAQRHNVLPLFEIEGVLTVALSQASGIFALEEIGEQVGLAMDAVLGEATAVGNAIRQHYSQEIEPLEPPVFASEPEPSQAVGPTSTPGTDQSGEEAADAVGLVPEFASGDAETAPDSAPVDDEPTEPAVSALVEEELAFGASTVDLDVLAVADDRRVAVLVTEILEQAVSRGATRIHLLPYKSDFFVVFRVRGRLEKVASAPLSMQRPLVDGFKSYVRLGAVAASQPALGRAHAEIAGRDVVLTVSSVPTVAGQRMVVGLAPVRPVPRDLAALGMAEPEVKALQAMIERGRGLLLVAAPVAGGRSSTYYALLQHAAQAGKTVYSVEQSVEYELPAVAQVLVNPGQPVGASGYFAAGMRQDTDVLALDAAQTVEDIHLAIEAAGLGKLVIVTYAGGGIVAAVRRLLDLGVEPVSLASALTLGVGQRVVRTNCPHCRTTGASPLAARIPGADAQMSAARGIGCSRCGSSGFAGATGLFEVLPFTEPVRATIAEGGTAEQIAEAAAAAGMRPLIASGLAKVATGDVSPEELDRVVRFSR